MERTRVAAYIMFGLAGALAGPALAQPIPCGLVRASGIHVTWDTGWDIFVPTWGAWMVQSAPSGALAVAGAISTQKYSNAGQGCPSGCVGDPWSDSDLCLDSDADSADLIIRPISAGAWCGVPYATGWANAYASSTACTAAAGISSFQEAYSASSRETTDCICFGDFDVSALSWGYGILIRNWVFIQPGCGGDMSYTRTRRYIMTLEMWAESNPCSPGPGGGGEANPIPQVVKVDFASSTLLATYTNGQKKDYTIQGVYVVYDNGTNKRLGFCADPMFNGVATPDGYVVDASYSATTTIPSVGLSGLVESADEDSYGKFDGDVDRDGKLWWLDRIAIGKRMNAGIGTMAYTARADLNLSGKITYSDLKQHNAEFGKLYCLADVNCDGVASGLDMVAYQQLYNDGNLAADMDGNGVLTSNDLVVYQGVLAAGC